MSSGVDQSFKIIESLSARRSKGFNELRRELNEMPSATLSRLLKNLIELGWAEKNPDGSYSCGKTAIATAAQIGRSFPEDQLMEKYVTALALKSGESAAFGIWDGDAMIFKCKHEIAESFRYMDLNKKNFDSGNLFVQTCMAYQSEAAIEHIIGELAEKNKLKSRLEAIRTTRISIYEDSRSSRICAPVMKQNSFYGVLGISVSKHNLSDAERAVYAGYLESILTQVEKDLAAY